MRALERRLWKIEHRRARVDIDAVVDRCLEDGDFLRAAVLSAPGRPGTQEAAIDAELLALAQDGPI